jgi:hypothetical protein
VLHFHEYTPKQYVDFFIGLMRLPFFFGHLVCIVAYDLLDTIRGIKRLIKHKL